LDLPFGTGVAISGDKIIMLRALVILLIVPCVALFWYNNSNQLLLEFRNCGVVI